MRNLLLFLFSASLLFSCGGSNGNKTANGYTFTKHNASNGEKPKPGDLAFAHAYAYVDGELLSSTRQSNRMMNVPIYNNEELIKMAEGKDANPIYEALGVMNIGDSVSVEVPIKDEMRAQSPQLANAKSMVYDIVLVETKTKEAFDAETAAEKARMAAEARVNQAREPEIAALMTEMASKYTKGQLDDQITTTASGLKYMKLKEGEGQATQPGREVKVQYYGTLTDGSMFDNSFKRGQPFTFPLGKGRVIKGWDEGVALLKGGDQAILFIPSELGYGKGGSGAKIPGDSELMFYIEVL